MHLLEKYALNRRVRLLTRLYGVYIYIYIYLQRATFYFPQKMTDISVAPSFVELAEP